MIDHLSLGSRRYTNAVRFYAEVLAPLGIVLVREQAAEAAYADGAHWGFFLYRVDQQAVTASGMHVAFAARTTKAVGLVHEAALRMGAREIFSPQCRPDISPTYFGAMFEDLDGHRIEVLTNVVSLPSA